MQLDSCWWGRQVDSGLLYIFLQDGTRLLGKANSDGSEEANIGAKRDFGRYSGELDSYVSIRWTGWGMLFMVFWIFHCRRGVSLSVGKSKYEGYGIIYM